MAGAPTHCDTGCWGTSRYSGPMVAGPGWRTAPGGTGAPAGPRSARERTGLAEASGVGGPRCSGRRPPAAAGRGSRRGYGRRRGRASRCPGRTSRAGPVRGRRARGRPGRRARGRAAASRCPTRPGHPAAGGLRPRWWSRWWSRRGRCTHPAQGRPAAPPCLRSPAVPRPGPGRCRSCVPLAHRLVPPCQLARERRTYRPTVKNERACPAARDDPAACRQSH